MVGDDGDDVGGVARPGWLGVDLRLGMHGEEDAAQLGLGFYFFLFHWCYSTLVSVVILVLQ